MVTVEELEYKLINDPEIKKEYHRVILLSRFEALCLKIKSDKKYENKIRSLYRQTYDKINTTLNIIKNDFDTQISLEDATLMTQWILANLSKKDQRDPKCTSLEVKKKLYKLQNGLCALCGEPLGEDMLYIHVDHIIPFTYVGDELKDNYQDLCENCNKRKGKKINYILKKLLKI